MPKKLENQFRNHTLLMPQNILNMRDINKCDCINKLLLMLLTK